MANVNIELQEIIKRSQSERYEYPDIFTDDCGLDLKGYNGKYKAMPSWGHRKSNTLRRITLEITTYRGICGDAIHFYGKLVVQGVEMKRDPNEKDYDIHKASEWKDKNPLSAYQYWLKLTRPVTQAELDADKNARYPAEVRFEWADVGDLTERWNSTEELIDFATQVVKARFKGKWAFYVNRAWQTKLERIKL